MAFPVEFHKGNWASITVARKNIDLLSIEFYEDENAKKNYYCWYDKGHVKTFFSNYKLPARKRFKKAFRNQMKHWFPCCYYNDFPLVVVFEKEEMKYEELDWEYSEETGFVGKAVQVLVDAVKRKSVKCLSISAHDVESQKLICEELQKLDRIMVEFLELRLAEDSGYVYKLSELVHHKFYYGVGVNDNSSFSVTNEMLSKDFLALHHIVSNPDELKAFKGHSLAIGYGSKNGYDHTFVLEHFKRWLAGESVQFTYLQVSDGTSPSEDEKKWLFEEAEEVFHDIENKRPAEYIYRFTRSADGRQAEILTCALEFTWIVNPDDTKRGFSYNFPTGREISPQWGSLEGIKRIK